jgi:hypothetical protein
MVSGSAARRSAFSGAHVRLALAALLTMAVGSATVFVGGAGATSTTARGSAKPPRLNGTSFRTAKRIRRGVETIGDTGTVAYGSGSCGPEEGQFWKARLKAGEQVTILWGSGAGTVTGLDVYPPGTHKIEGSDDRRLTYQSIAGDPTKLTFTAPKTGVYPIVFDDSCGSPGPFHFVLITG